MAVPAATATAAIAATQMDIRMLGRPGACSGNRTDWHGWKFVMKAYFGASGEQILNAVNLAESQRQVITLAQMDPDEQRQSIMVAYITSQIAALTQQAAALTNKNDQIDKRLALIKLGDSKQTAVVDDGKECGGGEKRQRVN